MFSLSRIVWRKSANSAWIQTCALCATKITSKESPQQDVQEVCSEKVFASFHKKTIEEYGQPVPQTHPHLLKDGEILPGLYRKEFEDRRHRVMCHILESSRNTHHIVVIPSATKMYMTEKIPYIFRQNSDFLYLTGCLEPDCTLVMSASDEDSITSTLFLRKRDKHSELWDGPRTGIERAPSLFGVQHALPINDLGNYLTSCARSYNDFTLWYDFLNPFHPEVHEVMKNFLTDSTRKIWESPRAVIQRQRLFKSKAEQKLMQISCDIASAAISKTISVTRPGVTEHQLFATVDYESRMRGAEFLAYPPVCASGNNANIIHYISNTQMTKDGDMVLMDAGCQYSGYCSDITRTWPVSGKFSDPQCVLYEVVLYTQKKLIQMCSGLPSLDFLFHAMCRLLGRKLVEAGVISRSLTKEEEAKVAFDLCPHHVSHYLGMDVHDTGLIPRSIPMQSGMVITVEPGIYIPKHNQVARPEFRGQGIRIEDDVLITNSDPVVLSSSCPKEVKDIENLMKSA